jgi:hypothetical protein
VAALRCARNTKQLTFPRSDHNAFWIPKHKGTKEKVRLYYQGETRKESSDDDRGAITSSKVQRSLSTAVVRSRSARRTRAGRRGRPTVSKAIIHGSSCSASSSAVSPSSRRGRGRAARGGGDASRVLGSAGVVLGAG